MAARSIRTGNKTILGRTNFAVPPEDKREAFAAMCRHAARGQLSVPVEELPLDRIQDAWRRQTEGPHHKLAVRFA